MKILIRAGTVYPVTTAPLRNGAVAISGGVIEEVGKAVDFSPALFDKVIDLPDRLLLPGFVNAHSHLQLSSAKGKIKWNGSFTDWVREVITFNRSEPPDSRLEGMAHGIGEMMRSGITAVADIVTDARFAEPLAIAPLRSIVFLEAIGPLEKNADDVAQKTDDGLRALKEAGLRTGISPHAPHTVSQKLFRLLKKLAENDTTPLMTHTAETEEECEYIAHGTGPLHRLLEERGLAEPRTPAQSPVRFLETCDVLARTLAAHLNIIDDDDLALLLKRKTVPVFCPGASRWFGRKTLMPLDKLLKKGLRPAIGTDSLASNNSLSMLDELRHAVEYFPGVAPELLVEMATINGADALNLNCGALAKGRWADMAAVPHTGGDPARDVLRAGRASFLMVGGKVVFHRTST